MHANSKLSDRRLDRRTFFKLGSAAVIATAACPQAARASEMEERADLDALFQAHGVTGTFVLYDPAADKVTAVNGRRAAERYIPASTFKITNSLIALETGAVRDENEVVPYGGKPQAIKAWERDMSMRDAIAISNVPVYQEIARRVGLSRYREWLPRLGYGNAQVGDAVDRFWLDGPLEISAVEQARFVAALAAGKLPLSARSQSIVRDILRQEETRGRMLFAKTGWAFQARIGWWTGWVERAQPIAFSLNIDMSSVEDAPKRIALGKAILTRLDIF